jgi:hypothetical protein
MQDVLTDDQAIERIAENVAHFRGPRSRSWLAREAGTYPINITRIENKESMPGAGLIARIAEALEVSVDQLLAPPFKKSSRTA